MKKFEKFLFFYSIVAITIFFISFGVFSPTPLNFISGILILPTIFYFWIKMTNPENLTPERWSLRFILVILFLSVLGIFGFYLNSNSVFQNSIVKSELIKSQALNQKNEVDLANKILEIKNIKEKDATISAIIKDITIADLVNETPNPNSTQRITNINGISTIDVYKSPSTTSPKIGALETGINYPYIIKQDGWYKIVLNSTSTGWVSANQVQELN